MSTKIAYLDKLQSELITSAAPVRELIRRVEADRKKADHISGGLHGPVAFPSNPKAGAPFSIADALHVHIPKDSKPGTYDILFGINLLSPDGSVVAKAVLVWPVAPQFGP